jgi:hypothetical protein
MLLNLTKVISSPFKYAIEKEYIDILPYVNIKIPRTHGQTRRKRMAQIYSIEDIQKIKELPRLSA